MRAAGTALRPSPWARSIRLPGTPSHTPRGPTVLETALFTAGAFVSFAVLAYGAWRLLAWNDPARGESGYLRWFTVGLGAVGLLSAIRWFFFYCFGFAFVRKLRRGLPRSVVHDRNTSWPFVSVFVPCFNEGESIEAALESLLELDYPRYEVLVVNDGSQDDTLRRARKYAGTFGGCTVRVFDQPNGGKWSAHNLAFAEARAELVLCVDADSRLEPDALKLLVAHMRNPQLDGVAGQIRIRNRDRLVTRLQALEYVMGNGSGRLGQGLFDCVLVVPGPVGLYRRAALERVWRASGHRHVHADERRIGGPFANDTFAEDFDLSFWLLADGGRIGYEPRAVSRTKGPPTLFALIHQRYRWIRGSIQVLRKHARRLAAEGRRFPGRPLAWALATYVPELVLLPLVQAAGVGATLGLLASGEALVEIAMCWSGTLALQLHAGGFFVSVHEDSKSVLGALPFYGTYNASAMWCAWLISVVDEVRKARMRW